MLGGLRGKGRGGKKTCDVCGRKYASEENLMNHKQVFHGKDVMYDCKTCGVQFPSMEEIRAHMQRAHRYAGMRDGPGQGAAPADGRKNPKQAGNSQDSKLQ